MNNVNLKKLVLPNLPYNDGCRSDPHFPALFYNATAIRGGI